MSMYDIYPYLKHIRVLSTAKVVILFCFFQSIPHANGQKGLDYYLPDTSLSRDLPSPLDFFDFQIGEWHLSHDQLYYYLKEICERSDRCLLDEYARSHENRPLVNLVISSPDNILNIETLRVKHNSLTSNNSGTSDPDSIPLVLYQGYSIHGDESSGASAATLLAYYLLAGQSDYVHHLLDKTIILIDPCYNPDGLQRFSTWVNSNRHKNLVSDPRDREYNEPWPSARTNHYWFDLNRDWLFGIHPSSKGRITQFHKWQPDVLTDHHEMGSNSSFFFQPGVAERTNPNTPELNQKLTQEFGVYHAHALDSIGSRYFSGRRFDDYYYGKGSSYPDINGCIGILFEQASSRGHLQQTANGLLSFPFTIRNQLVTSFSTQRAALDLRSEVLNYKRDFYHNARRSASAKGYYVYESEDPFVARFFFEMLHRHGIETYRLKDSLSLGGRAFDPAFSYVIPKNQRQTALLKSLFETVHTFRDSIFYDVSTWTLPLALNLKYAESNDSLIPDAYIRMNAFPKFQFDYPEPDENTRALVIDWKYYQSPALLTELLDRNIKVFVLQKNIQPLTEDTLKDYRAGTLFVPLSDNRLPGPTLEDLVTGLARKYELPLELTSGYPEPVPKPTSTDPLLIEIQPIRVALLVGEGISAYEAGSAWYQMDVRMGMTFTKLEIDNILKSNLIDYDVIIMPDGNYAMDEQELMKLETWLRQGGRLVCFRRAVEYARKTGWLSEVEEVEDSDLLMLDSLTDIQQLKSKGSQLIGGSIFEARIDGSHPLFFGYSQKTLPIFKRGTQFYKVIEPTGTPMTYSASPVLSGYCSAYNERRASEAAAVFCASRGQGSIIACVDNPNFRGYWLAGSKLMANILYMSAFIDAATMMEER